jgi:hypothetical protein
LGGSADKCCEGLVLNSDGNCAYAFDCSGDTDTISETNPCMKHKSGAPCEADTECVVQNIGPRNPGGYGGYICVGNKYKSGGLGIGITPGLKCITKLRNLGFPGAYDGCTAEGDRTIPHQSGTNGIMNCCTLGVDPGCP